MRKKSDTGRHRVALAVLPGVPVFEIAVPCEVFGVDRSEVSDPWYELVLCAAEPRTAFAPGLATVDAHPLDDLVTADTVVVPACADVVSSQPADVVAAVAEAHRRGARVASVCTGAFVLAQAGLLDGRRATTHWMHADELARRYPRVLVDPAVIYVEDGGVHTSAGTAASMDLCVELVRRDRGTAVANELARRLVIPPHRAADQAQYVRLPVPDGAVDSIDSVASWVRAHLAEPLRLRDLAERAHLSERQLVRRFLDAYGVAPGEWVVRQRLRHAQELLETTELAVDRVAHESGFRTAAGLRAAFARHLHTSPSAYRDTWSVRAPAS